MYFKYSCCTRHKCVLKYLGMYNVFVLKHLVPFIKFALLIEHDSVSSPSATEVDEALDKFPPKFSIGCRRILSSNCASEASKLLPDCGRRAKAISRGEFVCFEALKVWLPTRWIAVNCRPLYIRSFVCIDLIWKFGWGRQIKDLE